jgi:hypothetical protein
MTIPSIAQRRADFIELIARQEHTEYEARSGFNMHSIRHSCGTPCCLEGFAREECKRMAIGVADLALASLCSIPENDGYHLASGHFSGNRMGDITPAEAVEALKSVFAKHPVEGDAS